MKTDLQETAPLKEYVLLLILAALWGGSFTLIKVALESYPPMTIVATRIMLGGLILAILAVVRGDRFPKTVFRWFELLIQGTLQGALPFFLITWAEIHVSSSTAGVINSTPPMFVFIISVFVLRNMRFDGLKFMGILAGMVGVALIATSKTGGLNADNMLAVFAVLGASCSYACGALLGHRFNDQSPFVTAGVSLLLASLLISPVALIYETPFSLAPTARATMALIGLTLLSTALASVIFFRLIKTLGSLATTSNAYLRALFSILLGVIFLGEEVTIVTISAIILIFLGVFLVTGQFRNLIVLRIRRGKTIND